MGSDTSKESKPSDNLDFRYLYQIFENNKDYWIVTDKWRQLVKYIEEHACDPNIRYYLISQGKILKKADHPHELIDYTLYVEGNRLKESESFAMLILDISILHGFDINKPWSFNSRFNEKFIFELPEFFQIIWENTNKYKPDFSVSHPELPSILFSNMRSIWPSEIIDLMNDDILNRENKFGTRIIELYYSQLCDGSDINNVWRLFKALCKRCYPDGSGVLIDEDLSDNVKKHIGDVTEINYGEYPEKSPAYAATHLLYDYIRKQESFEDDLHLTLSERVYKHNKYGGISKIILGYLIDYRSGKIEIREKM
ncbi:MAG: hypothetical protein Solumvirus4_2 [Solumvirus sp.]|uniref:Uncharacterized protein n=1 Tax=Solumvirus sp. TaxID=2487773 RepID=A0A3G5AI87_9VIRU|nr:MAG: hypothetical protein Solumvirus4_2 [Solumvirus sp.]